MGTQRIECTALSIPLESYQLNNDFGSKVQISVRSALKDAFYLSRFQQLEGVIRLLPSHI